MLISIFELGLIYALVALGIYLSFRIINFPDLSVDGTFPLGAAVAAVLLTKGINPIIATIAAMLAGMLAGAVTGLLTVRLKIMGLLASILTMTALYSVNIRIMGRPNIALMDVNSFFDNNVMTMTILISVVLFITLILYQFLTSQYGLGVRATGINPKISRSYGVNVNQVTVLILALSNGLVALAGALFAELQGFADVSLGTGTIVIGLASIMIGEAIIHSNNMMYHLFACVIGSILYRAAIALALNGQMFGLEASDLNLITAGIVTLALILPKMRSQQ